MTPEIDLETRLLNLLPKDGTPRSNSELRELIGANDEDYWRIRNQLLDEGRVAKSPGRGGRTALVVPDSKFESSASKVRNSMLVLVFSVAAVTVLASLIYTLVSWGRERVLWDALAIFFGGVTIAAVGVSMLIYKVQTDATRLETEGQARILKRLESLTRQAAVSSADARDILQVMRPAVDALSPDGGGAGLRPQRDDSENDSGDEPGLLSSGQTILTDHGTYYQPPAIPVRLLGDLVKWWEGRGETGRWTLSQLVGGYRAFNRSGNFIGMPWILTFESGDGEVRSFQVAYSGKQKGAAVKELAGDGVWREIDKSGN